MRVRAKRRGTRWEVRALAGAALAAWLALAFVVVELEPGRLGNRVAFFAAGGLALFVTCGLAAYGLSFHLFADERYRGNLGRALWHGGVAALVVETAALLQAGRLLSLPVGLGLIVAFLVGQIAVLLKE